MAATGEASFTEDTSEYCSEEVHISLRVEVAIMKQGALRFALESVLADRAETWLLRDIHVQTTSTSCN